MAKDPKPRSKPAYWTRLADGFRVQLRARGLPAPEPELHWDPNKPKRRFDWAWPDLGIALEVQGGAFLKEGGGHTRGAAFQRDCIRLADAMLLGWRVLTFTPQQVADGVAVKYLVRLVGRVREEIETGAYRPPSPVVSSVVPFGKPKRM